MRVQGVTRTRGARLVAVCAGCRRQGAAGAVAVGKVRGSKGNEGGPVQAGRLHDAAVHGPACTCGSCQVQSATASGSISLGATFKWPLARYRWGKGSGDFSDSFVYFYGEWGFFREYGVTIGKVPSFRQGLYPGRAHRQKLQMQGYAVRGRISPHYI